MGAVASIVAKSVLGHSDAENAFRPWWDNVQDHLIYGLITTGVIAFPKAMLNTSPIWCTKCTPDICPAKMNGTSEKPFDRWALRKCTYDPEVVDQFLLYFPYVILFVAVLLFVVEKFFNKMFKVQDEANNFYDLFVKMSVLKGKKDEETSSKLVKPSVKAYQMVKGIGSSNSYYIAYVCTTVTELILASGLFGWLYYHGANTLFDEEAINGTKQVPICKIGKHYWHCAGLPYQFFAITLIVSLVLLALFSFHSVYVLFWIQPWTSSSKSLRGIMTNFEETFKNLENDKNSYNSKGNLNSIYYNHRDTKLLLDILALNFGVAPCLKFLCIFDKNLQNTAKVEQLTANWQKTGSEGKSDLVVEFKNSKAVMEIFSKIPGVACTYVVEITPPVEEDSWIILDYTKDEIQDVEKPDVETDLQKARFEGVKSNFAYDICVSTQINGQTVAKSSIQAQNGIVMPEFAELQATEALDIMSSVGPLTPKATARSRAVVAVKTKDKNNDDSDEEDED